LSRIGTDVLDALEKRLGRRIGCGACRSRISSLDLESSVRFHDVVIMLMGDVGGAKELRPHAFIEIAKVVEQIVPRQSDHFTADPVLHFGAHLWPTKDTWQWHVNLWNQMPHLINGKCFVGIATDAATERFEVIRNALHPSIVCRQFDNTREGENPTFRWLQEVVPGGQNDILLYCHGKGAQGHTARSEAVRRWTEAMYSTVIFNHDMIKSKIVDGYNLVGSFREFGRTHLMPRYRWHFTGTFFAVRAKLLAGKLVKPIYGGVESWIGDHFQQFEGWSEFGDGTSHQSLYNIDSWRSQITPALTEWWRRRNYEHV
jgi:hypothetical protein